MSFITLLLPTFCYFYNKGNSSCSKAHTFILEVNILKLYQIYCCIDISTFVLLRSFHVYFQSAFPLETCHLHMLMLFWAAEIPCPGISSALILVAFCPCTGAVQIIVTTNMRKGIFSLSTSPYLSSFYCIALYFQFVIMFPSPPPPDLFSRLSIPCHKQNR